MNLYKTKIQLALIEIFRLKYSVVELPDGLLFVINENINPDIPFDEMVSSIENQFALLVIETVIENPETDYVEYLEGVDEDAHLSDAEWNEEVLKIIEEKNK